jgi:hypothetical protein
MIDPPSRHQKVRVQVSSPNATVNVYCFLEKDREAARKAISWGPILSPELLASAEDCNTADLKFTIPPYNSAVVLLTSPSDRGGSAKVVIDGR